MNNVWIHRLGIGVILLGLSWVIGGFFYSLLPSFGGFGGIGSALGIVFLGVAALIGFSIWRGATSQAGVTAANLGTIISEQPIRGILIGAVLLVVAYLVYDHFWSLSATLVGYSGISVRVSWFVLGLLALLVLPSIFVYFSPTGLPVEASTAKRAARGLMFVWILFFGWLFYERPNDLYGHADGTVKCWIAENDPKIYSSPGFSSLTGAKLRQCTRKEALAAEKQPWTEEAKLHWQLSVDAARKFWADQWRKPEIVPSGVRKTLRVGREYTFTFRPEGFEFVAKFGQVAIKCDPTCNDEQGILQEEIILDLREWYRDNRRYLRYSNPEPFRLTIRSLSAEIMIRTF